MPTKITKIREESTLPKKVEWRGLPWQIRGTPREPPRTTCPVYYCMTVKKKPILRRTWALAWSIAALPATLVYGILRGSAYLVARLIVLSLFLAPRCRPDESLSNPISHLIDAIINKGEEHY